MKRSSIALAGLLLLSGCGGGGDAAANCDPVWDGTVGICLPEGWITLNSETLRQRGVPEETIVAFQSEEAVSGQFPTAVVTQERLAQVMDPDAYSEANVRAVTVVPGYEVIDTRGADVDGNSVNLHIYTAQPVAEEPKRRYYQVSTVAGDSGYTLTATAPVSLEGDIEQEILTMMNSLTFVEPATEEE